MTGRRRCILLGTVVCALLAATARGEEGIWQKYGARSEHLLQLLAAGNYQEVEAAFNPLLRRQLGAPQLAASFDPIRPQLGAYVRTVRHEEAVGPPGTIASVVTLFAKFASSETLLKATFVYDRDGLVGSMQVVPIADEAAPTPTPAKANLASAWQRHEPLVRTLLKGLIAGSYPKVVATFDPTLKEKLTVAQLRGIMDALRPSLGRFTDLVSHHPLPLPDYPGTAWEIMARFDTSPTLLKVAVTFDEKDRLAGLFLAPTQIPTPPPPAAPAPPAPSPAAAK